MKYSIFQIFHGIFKNKFSMEFSMEFHGKFHEFTERFSPGQTQSLLSEAGALNKDGLIAVIAN
jgi:hypothetical protein